MSSTSIKFKRGNKADLPQSAPSGTPLWCEDSHELYMGTGNGVTKASKNDVVEDTTNSLRLMGVPENNLTDLKTDSAITMQGGVLRALQFIGNLIGNATCDGNGNNIANTYATQEALNTTNGRFANYQLLSQKGQANGYAPLNANSIVSYDYLPNDIANKSLSNLNSTGEDKLNTSKMYLTGETSSDPTGYAQLLAIKNDILAKSIIDVAINNNYTIMGTPSINQDAVSFTSNMDCIVTKFYLPETMTDYKVIIKFVASAEMKQRSNSITGNYSGYNGMRLQSQPNGSFMAYHNTQHLTNSNAMITTYLQTPVLNYSAGDVITLETGYNSEKGFYVTASANGVTVENNEDTDEYWYKDTSVPLIIGRSVGNYSDDYYCTASVDLSEFRCYVEGSLVYVPSLHIPCTSHKNGVKIADIQYSDKVALFKEYKGYSPYFTIDETNHTFTLPMGEIYGMIDKKANIDLVPIKPLGQIISSAFPITDKNAVLCDGSIISSTNNYVDFVNKMNYFYNLNNETLSCWAAEDFLGEVERIYIKGSIWSGTKFYNADGTEYTGSAWKLKSTTYSYVPTYVDPMWETETPANRRSSDDVILHNLPEFMTTESNWQSLNTANGECGKFVYNENNNTVRLPNLKVFPSNGYGMGEYKYVVVSQLL